MTGGADWEQSRVKDRCKMGIFLHLSFPPLEFLCGGPRLLASCIHLDTPAASRLGLPWGYSNWVIWPGPLSWLVMNVSHELPSLLIKKRQVLPFLLVPSNLYMLLHHQCPLGAILQSKFLSTFLYTQAGGNNICRWSWLSIRIIGQAPLPVLRLGKCQ